MTDDTTTDDATDDAGAARAAARAFVDAEQAAKARLIERFGTDRHRRYAADPNGPRVDPMELITRVLLQDVDDRLDRLGVTFGSEGYPAPTAEDLADALRMLAPARREFHGCESNLITAARRAGLTWKQIAESLGYDSPQAAQQHYKRLGGQL